jgi:alpha-amylase
LPKLRELEPLLRLRKDFSYGKQVDYFQDKNCIGWVRQGDTSIPGSGCAVILGNHPAKQGSIEMEIGRGFAGKKFVDYLGNCNGEVIIDEDGRGTFLCNSKDISVWVPADR